MALILNIETSTKACSVALGKDGALLANRERIQQQYSHAEHLTVFMAEVMEEAGLSWGALDAVAVSSGPGSFTGLRIGVAAAKGICYGRDIPLVSMDALRIMAHGTSATKKSDWYCPMIDARRMEVYTALFDGDLKQVEPAQARVIHSSADWDILLGKGILFFGDGAFKFKEALNDLTEASWVEGVHPLAKLMVSLSEQKFQEGSFEEMAYFEPFYLKDFVGGAKAGQKKSTRR